MDGKSGAENALSSLDPSQKEMPKLELLKVNYMVIVLGIKAFRILYASEAQR